LIDFDKLLVIIPARKGSKGIPGKNKKMLNGKPLIQYTIDVAKKIFPITTICISTDDLDIQQIGSENGLNVPDLRPDNLSNDESSARDVILYEVLKTGRQIDTIIYLQPTSPLRTTQNIQEAIDLYDRELMDMLVSVTNTKANPYFNLFEEDENENLVLSKMHKSKSRQEAPKVYQFNGAIYIINFQSITRSEIAEFKKINKYVMSEENSIDIDEPVDWILAEILLQTS
jgi:CMP-N,N'-diacetyllegionaminic acid synthase